MLKKVIPTKIVPTRLTYDVVDQIDDAAKSAGTTRHRLCQAAIQLGLPMAKYQVALEGVMEDRARLRAEREHIESRFRLFHEGTNG